LALVVAMALIATKATNAAADNPDFIVILTSPSPG
jgi:hypothetical protein